MRHDTPHSGEDLLKDWGFIRTGLNDLSPPFFDVLLFVDVAVCKAAVTRKGGFCAQLFFSKTEFLTTSLAYSPGLGFYRVFPWISSGCWKVISDQLQRNVIAL
jgi:hypothetical protein